MFVCVRVICMVATEWLLPTLSENVDPQLSIVHPTNATRRCDWGNLIAEDGGMYVVTAWEAERCIPLLNATPILFPLDKVVIVLVTSMSVISLTPALFLITLRPLHYNFRYHGQDYVLSVRTAIPNFLGAASSRKKQMTLQTLAEEAVKMAK